MADTARVRMDAARPRSAYYLKAALLVTGGLAAGTALAALLRDPRSASARPPSLASMDFVAKFAIPKGPSHASFEAGSKPYKPRSPLGAHEAGAILINEDGVMNKYYLPGATTLHGGRTVKYLPPYRYYLMEMPTTDYSVAANFHKLSLLGKTFTVDITLTGVGCGCNVNFYLVDMPALAIGKDGDHYCDAQCFPDLGCCAEFDMNEGNANLQQVANHACTDDYPDHPDWQCHKWGDPGAKTTQAEFQDGRRGKIDGSRKFTFAQEFRMENGLLRVITTISQGNVKVVKSMGPSEQLQSMLKDGSLEKGMVFVTGYWTATDMNWLDGDACGLGPETCSGAPAYISNWRIRSAEEPESMPVTIPQLDTLGLASAGGSRVLPSSSAWMIFGAFSLAAGAVACVAWSRRRQSLVDREALLQSDGVTSFTGAE